MLCGGDVVATGVVTTRQARRRGYACLRNRAVLRPTGASMRRIGKVIRSGDLDEIKRPAYLVGLVLGMPVVLLVAVHEGGTDPVIRLAYPALFAVLAVTAVCLARRTMSVARAERIILGVVPLLWFARLVDALYLQADLPLAREVVTTSIGPGLSIVVILIYLASDARRGLQASMVLCVAFGVIVAPRALPELTGAGDGSHGLALLRMVVYTTIIALLVYVLANLKEEVDRHRERAEGLDLLAGTDVVTGLANRRRAIAVLSEQLHRAHRYDRPLSVALLDLDQFKTINDTEGHAAGDRALRQVAETLTASLRRVDTLARWGGDELLVIAPETTLDQLRFSADRWRSVVTEQGIRAGDGRLTVSVGVTTREPGDTVDTLVQRADTALYEAKGTGRDRTVVG
jgi:diguanylate cyclase (GGDEF)-like protein